MKYTAVGVVEIDKGPNAAAINLPDFSKTAAPAPPSKTPTPAPASKAPTPASTVSKAPPPQPASASGKASAPANEGTPVASTREAPPQDLPQGRPGEQEIMVRVPVLVNTRDIEVGEELFRIDVKGSNKRSFDPVSESVLLKKAARVKGA